MDDGRKLIGALVRARATGHVSHEHPLDTGVGAVVTSLHPPGDNAGSCGKPGGGHEQAEGQCNRAQCQHAGAPDEYEPAETREP